MERHELSLAGLARAPILRQMARADVQQTRLLLRLKPNKEMARLQIRCSDAVKATIFLVDNCRHRLPICQL